MSVVITKNGMEGVTRDESGVSSNGDTSRIRHQFEFGCANDAPRTASVLHAESGYICK
jgi:hypothetical protein